MFVRNDFHFESAALSPHTSSIDLIPTQDLLFAMRISVKTLLAKEFAKRTFYSCTNTCSPSCQATSSRHISQWDIITWMAPVRQADLLTGRFDRGRICLNNDRMRKNYLKSFSTWTTFRRESHVNLRISFDWTLIIDHSGLYIRWALSMDIWWVDCGAWIIMLWLILMKWKVASRSRIVLRTGELSNETMFGRRGVEYRKADRGSFEVP